MRVLITGGGGFLAGHLLAQLQGTSGIEVRSLARAECDLSQDDEKLFSVLRAFQPDRVFHLAGRINGSEEELFRNNQLATRNLLEGVRRAVPATRVVLGSTAAVYGSGGSEAQPLSEDRDPAPLGQYAASKYAAEEEAGLHAQAGSWIVTARMTNPVGPNMSTALFCGTLARQIVEIERGGPPILALRDLTPKRDFISARDCVRALWHMAEFGTSDSVYNVASGVATPIAQIVEIFRELSLARPIEVRSCLRDGERSSVLEQYVSNKRLLALGWKPEQTMREAIGEQLQAERGRA
jgi:GDP-4-dehydro-6-deoxy-D-mannose reductase